MPSREQTGDAAGTAPLQGTAAATRPGSAAVPAQGSSPPAKAPQTTRSRGSVASLINRYGTLLGLLALVLFFYWRSPVFMSVTNFTNVLTASAILGIIAAGLTVVLVILEFDLSIGYTATASGMLAAGVAQTYGLFGGGVAAVLLGLVVGVVNGLVVTRLGVSAFIATLAMGQVLAGWLLAYNEGQQIQYDLPSDFDSLGTGKVAGIPYLVIFWFAVLVVLWVLLEHTAFGRKLYAVGANPVAARLSGIRLDQVRVVAFALCGAAAGLAGLLLASNIGAGNPLAGLGYLLPAFASCFIGAATLRAGQFHIWGTLVGVIILGVLQNGLVLVGVSPAWSTAAQGIVLVVAVAISGLFQKLASR
jgi:ribose transport system permease protein